ncbi:hypothetical protein AQF52_6947 [Streptomyces venezuelae]|uniref:hypothetical protein n=1 Tax=Streptomyces gardneri TaxID=66892 RepID=UPI0006BD5BF7|nr:hypothetical protein [Streptomyces gardneri]ALO12533.1 hypothetical protein AQF52_6947 [Streptomyces venezuelae]QPK49291.1 hypothetical protein H4W23_34880 [Streptomyces gardneri]WRK40807.1 hypothetical protein U0M97_35085 [Streptomyces venezuelae]CUM36838.1 hypothetical protein BN2537_2641 [Streptomyces venezuelae]
MAAFIVFAVVVLRAATVPFVLALLGTALLKPLMPVAREGTDGARLASAFGIGYERLLA